MEVRLDKDAEFFLLELRVSKHVTELRLSNDLNDALDCLEDNHDVDSACRRHRYQLPDLGAMFGFVTVSSRESWTVLWRYFDEYILVHAFVKAN